MSRVPLPFRRSFARALRVFGLLTVIAASASGCHFAQVQADPNDPLYQNRLFAIEPLTFTNLMVGDKPEALYLSGKKPEQQQSFEADKADAARLFGARFNSVVAPAGITVSEPRPDVPFILRVNVEYFEPGNFNGFVNLSTELRMTMYVFSVQGQMLGQTPLVAQVPATLGNPSSGGRFRQAAESLGDAAAHYILRRTGLGY